MRKIFLIFALLFSISCSSENEGQLVIEAEWMVKARQLLEGVWNGELVSPVTGLTECEDIVFTPFDTPKEQVSIFGEFIAYGVAELEHYFDDHLLQTEYRCLFTILDYDTSDGLLIAFYPCNEKNEVTGREDKRILFVESSTKFYMRKYGLTKENNFTYIKQN